MVLSLCLLSYIIGTLATFVVVKNSEICTDDEIPFTVEITTKFNIHPKVTTPLWQLQLLDQEMTSNQKTIIQGTNYPEAATTYQEFACLPYGSYRFQIFQVTSSAVASYALESKNYILKTAYSPFVDGSAIWSLRIFPFTTCKLDIDCPVDSCSDSFCNEFGFCESVTSCSKCNKTSAKVSVKTDKDPQDTTWRIYSTSDDVIVARSKRYFKRKQIHEQIICLDSGKAYKFIIEDCGCTGDFNGWYSLSLNNSTNLFEKQGYFHKEEITAFGICNSDDQCHDSNSCSEDICDLEKSICVYEKKHCVDCLPGYVPCDQDQDICIPSSCQECRQVDYFLQITTKSEGARLTATLTEASTNNVTKTVREYLGRYALREHRLCLQHNNSYLLTLEANLNVMKTDCSLLINNYLHTRVVAPTLAKQHQIVLCTEDRDCEALDSCHVAHCNQTTKQCLSTALQDFSQCRTYGSPSVLVIRAIATDRETSTTSHELSNYVFGTFGKTFNMKSQMSACSYNKFNIIPFQGITSTGIVIKNGVVDIEIFLNVAGEQVGTVANRVFEEAQKVLGNLESQFDFLMICLPPDTLLGDSSNWKAYAFVNSYQSFYNDLACNYPSVQIHELGHNLGLSHSNDEENYGDLSGYMGASYSLTDGPKKCFNGVKSWQLGWYLERHFLFDASINFENYVYFSVFGISDNAGLPLQNHYNIIKLINCGYGFDYYITFNRKNGIQSETSEGVNKLLITKQLVGLSYDDSLLVERLATYVMYEIKINRQGSSKNLQIYPVMKFRNDIQYADVFITNYENFCLSDAACDDDNICTVDDCFLNVCIHELKPCDECGGFIEVKVKSNNHPQNIYWNIRKLKDETVMFANDLYYEPYAEFRDVKCLMYEKYIFSITYSGNNSLSVGEVEYSFSVGPTIMENNTISTDTFYESFFVICATDADCNDHFGCSLDICNQETNLCENFIDEGLESCRDCIWFSINITTDNFPEETSWELYDKKNNILIIGGDPYPFDFSVAYGRRKAPTRSGRRKAPTRAGRRKAPTRSSTFTGEKIIPGSFYDAMNVDGYDLFEELCLSSNILFRFSIFDSFGDGICCTEGTGSYVITIGHSVARIGGDFGDSDNLLFQISSCNNSSHCNSELCAIGTCDSNIGICTYSLLPCLDCGSLIKVNIITDLYPYETSWAIFRESDLILERGPFSTAFKLYQESVCLPYGYYNFEVHDVVGDGMTQCNGATNLTCGYFVSVNDEIFSEGDLDSTNEVRIFVAICREDKNCDDSDPCTLDRCDLTNRICIFDQISCADCNMASFEVIVNTDNFPREITWELVNEMTKELELFQGPYFKHYFQYTKVKCLREGSYKFNIFDYDGLCSEQTENIIYDDYYFDDDYFYGYDDSYVDYTCGNYSISLNNEIIHEGGIFTNQETTKFEILLPTFSPSMLPSLLSKNPLNEWSLNLQQVSKFVQNNTETILMEYLLPKKKSIEQITVKILDVSCSDKIESEVITLEKKKLRVLEDEANDIVNVFLRINKTSLREESVWKNTSPYKGTISFCVKTELNSNKISISFDETKIIVMTNLLASTFEVENISVQKGETTIANQVAVFEVSSCLCDRLNICLDRVTLMQNSLIRVCVFPTNEMLVEAFVGVLFYQDLIPKLIAIEEKKQNKLVSVTIGSVGVLETRAISVFFDEPSPSPVILKGEVTLSFPGDRVLTSNEEEHYEQVYFETEIKLKKRLMGELSTAILFILVVIFASIGIKFLSYDPYLDLRSNDTKILLPKEPSKEKIESRIY